MPYRAILSDGSGEIEGRCRRHDFLGWAQRYDRVEKLLEDGGLTTGRVLQPTAQVLDCRVM